MTLRKRLSLIAAASVAIAVTIAVVVCYTVVRHQLPGQVDNELKPAGADRAEHRLPRLAQPLPGMPASAGGPAQYAQVRAGRRRWHDRGGRAAAADQRPHAQRLAGQWRARFSATSGSATPSCGCSPSRVDVVLDLTTGARPSRRARSSWPAPQRRQTRSSPTSASSCSWCCSRASRLAAVLGRMASRRVLAPLAEVADVAQEIGETEDLTKRLHVHADDEVGQLATNFNAMLDRLEASREALDESVRAQRQLVADASHELRTPVTSLRTNIEVLLEEVELEPEDRRRLLADVVEQSEELTALVGDLIELARGDQPGADTDDVRLDGVAAESLARARRNAPGIHFEATLVPTLVDGCPRAPGAGHQQPARQRGPPLSARRHRGATGRAPGRRGPRPWHRRRPRGPPLRVRPLLPRAQLPGPPGQRAGPGHRAPGGPAARRQRVGGQRRRRRRDLHAAPAGGARRGHGYDARRDDRRMPGVDGPAQPTQPVESR